MPNKLSPETPKEAALYGAALLAVGGLGITTRKIKRLRTTLREKELEVKYWEKEANVDSKTGLMNKKAFLGALETRLEGSKPFGLIMIDINAFKKANDNTSHNNVDEMLARYGQTMSEHFKRKDDALATTGAAARFGGDEFAILVDLTATEHNHRATDPNEAFSKELEYTRSVNNEFAQSEIASDSRLEGIGFGFSIGGTVWQPLDKRTPGELFDAADAAMYADKRQQQAERVD
jgi:diguanylate cyclase (GGDEF)-like protein